METRAAGVGESSGTMLKLYTDDVRRGFKVYLFSIVTDELMTSDPVVVMVLSLEFIFSVFCLQ